MAYKYLLSDPLQKFRARELLDCGFHRSVKLKELESRVTNKELSTFSLLPSKDS